MLYDPKWEVPVEAKPIEPWRKELLDAAAEIERRGFCKCAGEIGGAVCTLGALSIVTGGSPHNWIDMVGYGEAYFRLSGFVGGSILHWNDHPSRTKEEVIAALRRVAAD